MLLDKELIACWLYYDNHLTWGICPESYGNVVKNSISFVFKESMSKSY